MEAAESESSRSSLTAKGVQGQPRLQQTLKNKRVNRKKNTFYSKGRIVVKLVSLVNWRWDLQSLSVIVWSENNSSLYYNICLSDIRLSTSLYPASVNWTGHSAEGAGWAEGELQEFIQQLERLRQTWKIVSLKRLCKHTKRTVCAIHTGNSPEFPS